MEGKLSMKELETVGQFLHDSHKNSGVLTQETADKIKLLWDKYKKTTVSVGDVIITAEAGKFGNVNIYNVDVLHSPVELKYEKGSYQYVTLETGCEKTILWTDFSNTEPFNRQSPFYVGFGFRSLTLVKTEPEYREYYLQRPARISFGVYTFQYNPYWEHVHFGLCISAEHEEEFMKQLRELLGK